MSEICSKCKGYMEYAFDENNRLVNQCIRCGHIEPINNEHFKANKCIDIDKIKMQAFINNLKDDFNNNDKLIVVSYLRSIRESKGLSQKQMADFFDFTVQRYGNVERHYNSPSIVLICQFSYILNTPVSDLFKTIQISNTMYEEMKNLKIKKNELIKYEDLIKCENELKSETLSGDAYEEIKKKYNTLLKSKDAFLKQGDVVENIYWEKFLALKDESYLIENIRNYK